MKCIACRSPSAPATTDLPLSSHERQLQLVFRISKQTFTSPEKKDPDIWGMSYNSVREMLYLADNNNQVLPAVVVCDCAGNLRNIYKASHDTSPVVWSVCYLSDSDTLLMCLSEVSKQGQRQIVNWLVALSRNGSTWREAHRVQTDRIGSISCALSDSRVLIGDWTYTYMELFRVDSGQRIERLHRIYGLEQFLWFSATCGSDTLVAMAYSTDKSVRLHLLLGVILVELARIQLKMPTRLLWLADRLLVADWDCEKQLDAIIELVWSKTGLERGRELIATNEHIIVRRWCAVVDGLAIFDENSKDILLYSFI